MEYWFESPLTEGVIKSRPNRFLMMVQLGPSIVKCHCPATGRIGDLIFQNVPCLLSMPRKKSEVRKTEGIVEAISLDPIEKQQKSWIGINQIAANRYLEHFITTGQMKDMLREVRELKREVRLGDSRIDFATDDTYIEVKSPLTELPSSPHVLHVDLPSMTSFDRLIKHFKELSKRVKKGKRGIVLLCYQFDAPPFRPPPMDRMNERVERVAMEAERSGIENWQANLCIDSNGVRLIRYFKLNLFRK
jgi:sugar fermentation stimulation protein A